METNSRLILVLLIHLVRSIDGLPIESSYDIRNIDQKIIRRLRATHEEDPFQFSPVENKLKLKITGNDHHQDYANAEKFDDCDDVDIDEDFEQVEKLKADLQKNLQLKFRQSNLYDDNEFDTSELDQRSMEDDMLRRYWRSSIDETDSFDFMQLLSSQNTNDSPFMWSWDYGYMGDAVDASSNKGDDEEFDYDDYEREFDDDYE